MIVHLLTLRRHGSNKRSAAVYKVGTLVIRRLIDKEIFLLGTYGRIYALYIVHSEKLYNSERLLIYSVHAAKQRCFLVKRLAAV